MVRWNTLSWSGRLATAALVLASILVIYLFLASRYDFIDATGLFCADDAYFAMIAKTLAETGIYGLPYSWTDVARFDPAIGVGPGLILPEAFLIKLFGIDHRIPGLSVLIIQAFQSLAIISVLSRCFGYISSIIYIALTLFISIYLSSAQNFFGVNVGEVPMLGFLILGVVLLAGADGKTAHIAWAGVAFALAMLTKQAALFAVAAACAAWAIATLLTHLRSGVMPVVVLFVSTALPVAIFELIRWRTLGSAGFIANWRAILQVQKSFGSPDADPWTIMHLLSDTYRVTVPVVAAFALSVVLLAIDRTAQGVMARRIAWLSMAAALGTTLAFVTSGFTNPRYLWSAPILAGWVIALPIIFQNIWQRIAIITAVFVLVQSPLSFYEAVTQGMDSGSKGLMAERRGILSYINAMPTDIPVYGQSWHSLFDVAYFLPSDRHWFTSNREADVGASDALYVFFSQFAGHDQPMYALVTKECERQLPDTQRFEVYSCRKGGSGAPAVPPAP